MSSGRNRPIKAILFDWAGTTVDYGSRSPTQVFLEVFRRRGVEITVDEARGPMGRAKHEHIAMVAAMPRVAELWKKQHGTTPTAADIEMMYREFLPLQKEILKRGSDVIPGVVEAVDLLRRHGIRIGSSTGYTRELMDVVLPVAAAQGYAPDVVICADEVPAGRPAPWMNFRAMELLDVYPPDTVMIVDDTLVGIQAGLNAGMRTVGISLTGNSLGLSQQEVQAMAAPELASRLQAIESSFLAAGAHHVIRSVAELPELLNIDRT